MSGKLHLTKEEIAAMREAVHCDHEGATVISDVAGRKVVKCAACGFRVTTFSPDWQPPPTAH